MTAFACQRLGSGGQPVPANEVMIKRILKTCLACCLVLNLCLPVPGRAGLAEVSIADEAELGREFSVLMQAKFPLIEDPVVTGFINELSSRIASVMPPQPFRLRVRVVRDGSINAFAAPAGYIFVHSGLILHMEDQGELAAVIAHEMAHVSERHIAKNIERSRYLSIGTLVGMLAGAMLGSATGSSGGSAVAIGSLAGAQSAALKYSREDEREADQVGLDYLTKAGFTASSMVESFERIKQSNLLSGTGTPPAYISTHPGLTERISYVQDLAERRHSATQGQPFQPERFKKVQMILRSRYTDAGTAIRFYDKSDAELSPMELLGKAVVLQRLHNIQSAEEYFRKARAQLGEDSLWHREFGRFAYEQGRFEQALGHLNAALNQNPSDIMALYFKGLSLAELDRHQESIQALRQVARSVPEDSEVHTTLGRVLGRSGQEFEGYLHFAYANLYRKNEDKMRYFMGKARSLASSPDETARIEQLQQEYRQRSKYW